MDSDICKYQRLRIEPVLGVYCSNPAVRTGIEREMAASGYRRDMIIEPSITVQENGANVRVMSLPFGICSLCKHYTPES